MSVTHCVFCDNMVDTDWHETCPSCERDPFGEYMFCDTCEHFVEPASDLLRSKLRRNGSCKRGHGVVDYDTEACNDYSDKEYA